MRLRINKVTRAATITVLMALAVACSSEATEAGEGSATQSKVKIVATTDFIADWVDNVGGDRVDVVSLLPVGSDPHAFAPGARDVIKIADADMVLSVGLNMEAGWLTELVENASADPARVVALGEIVEPIDARRDEGRENEERPLDPHFWFDPIRVELAVTELASLLTGLDPRSGEAYVSNAVAYGVRLGDLHGWIEEQVGVIPSGRRLLVTSHDSFQYFAERYGFEVVGSVIPGTTTEVEPSAEDLAGLADLVEERGVPAIFGGTNVSDRLADAVSKEAGAQLIRLYSGSLGPAGSGAETYIGMVETNVKRIVEALR